MTTSHLYFAYGSNLCSLELANWGLAGIEPVGPASLLDHELAFTRRSVRRGCGVLDAMPIRGSLVPGYTFRVTETDLARLDEKEGARGNNPAYERVERWAVDEADELVRVITYVVRQREADHVRPNDEYLTTLRRGREERGLGLDDLRRVMRREARPNALECVFAYGTLMRCESRAHLLAEFEPTCWILGEARGSLRDCGEYPGLVWPGEALDATVQGEFVRFEDRPIDELFATLDAVEAFHGYGEPGSLFVRRPIDVGVGDGRVRRAWTYVLASEAGCSTIASGDWREHRGRRARAVAAIVRGHVEPDAEREAARWLAENDGPFGREDADSLLPLADAVLRGDLSERRLAMYSRRSTVGPLVLGRGA